MDSHLVALSPNRALPVMGLIAVFILLCRGSRPLMAGSYGSFSKHIDLDSP